MLKKDFTKKDWDTSKCCIHTRYNIPLVQIKLNRMTRHVSVDGQVVIRRCANGTLKYHKYQDIEAEFEQFTNKWLTTKLVATTVSSRFMEIKRRSEGMTVSSHEEETVCEGQEHETMKVKGGGRQRLKHVDGDLPLCMRKNEG